VAEHVVAIAPDAHDLVALAPIAQRDLETAPGLAKWARPDGRARFALCGDCHGDMLPPVRQLFPIALEDVDPLACYRNDERKGDPWVMINMITSADGATAVNGRSGALGGPADKRVFAAIRSVADVILVGAGTVRAENYGPPSVPARLAIVTAKLDLAPDAKVFSNGYRPIIVTTEDADATRRAELERVADVIVAGQGHVDPRAALRNFSGVVLCEGGPSLNGQLIADGLVDELCVSVAPVLASGESARIAHGPDPEQPVRVRLMRTLEEDGMLFLRYVSDASVPFPS
jgi:riboflavin biosynthesis pyrimidine reductase